MWRYSALILLLTLGISSQVNAQNTEDSISSPKKILEVGFTFDYLKLHTLAIEESEKWEFAANITILDQYAIIGEYGIASLTPEEAYYNASYNSEGSYYRLGIDYQIPVNTNNLIMLGLRYSQANYSEDISYRATNPLFDEQTGELVRENLSATWYEIVITSEKSVKSIFKQPIPDILSLGFKFRLKTNLEFEQFDYIETKQIPGFGDPINKLNPEVNLYIKFRLPIIKSRVK